MKLPAQLTPIVRLCRGCGERPVEHDGSRARPRVTCSPECARNWATARARASRAKLKAIKHLKAAIEALQPLLPCEPATQLCAVLVHLSGIKSGDLAAPPRQPELGFHPAEQRPELRR